MVQRVVVHGDVSHRQHRRGTDSPLQRQGLGEAISFTTHQGRNVLVDAGDRGSALHEKLREPVDVLLLTHNDQDHVGGAPELLGSSLGIGEVWLPYDWYLLYAAGMDLVDALRSGDTDLNGVADEALGRVTSEVKMLRHHLETGERLSEPGFTRRGHGRVLGQIDEALGSLNSGIGAEVVLRAQRSVAGTWIGSAELTAQGVTSGGAPGRRARATVSVIDAVLKLGHSHRWFSIDLASAFPQIADLPWRTSGMEEEFTLVNAWQVQPRPLPPALSPAVAFARLAVLYHLTIQNRRALVALGHVPFEGGHVLFASDSGFEFDGPAHYVVPWPKIGAVVGLHHGSDKSPHDHLYECFEGTALARSGSRYVPRTHPRFTRVPPHRRGCTWCHADDFTRGGYDRHRDVGLEANQDGAWRVVNGACTDCPRFG